MENIDYNNSKPLQDILYTLPELFLQQTLDKRELIEIPSLGIIIKPDNLEHKLKDN